MKPMSVSVAYAFLIFYDLLFISFKWKCTASHQWLRKENVL